MPPAVWRGYNTLSDYFWSHVSVSGVCWEWTGNKYKKGYGRFSYRPKSGDKRVTVRAHRWAWEYLVGSCPEGLEPDHLCRNTSCVNPDHIEWVTHKVNTLRSNNPAAQKARMTHCAKGHKLPDTKPRRCVPCKRERNKLWMRKQYVTP